MVLDRCPIAKRLVGTFEVVFNEPVGKLRIEAGAVCSHIAQRSKLIRERAVEPFRLGVD